MEHRMHADHWSIHTKQRAKLKKIQVKNKWTVRRNGDKRKGTDWYTVSRKVTAKTINQRQRRTAV